MVLLRLLLLPERQVLLLVAELSLGEGERCEVGRLIDQAGLTNDVPARNKLSILLRHLPSVRLPGVQRDVRHHVLPHHPPHPLHLGPEAGGRLVHPQPLLEHHPQALLLHGGHTEVTSSLVQGLDKVVHGGPSTAQQRLS